MPGFNVLDLANVMPDGGVIISSSYDSTAIIYSRIAHCRPGGRKATFYTFSTQSGDLALYFVDPATNTGYEIVTRPVTANVLDIYSHNHIQPYLACTFTPDAATPGTVKVTCNPDIGAEE